jgi:putative sigma-54 modulation protein
VKVSVEGRHMAMTAAMRQYAQEKAEKLPRYYDGLRSVNVTLDMEAGLFSVEMVASGKRKRVFVAHHRGDDMYACVDQCCHKLEEQIRRHKDRVRDRQGPTHGEAATE